LQGSENTFWDALTLWENLTGSERYD